MSLRKIEARLLVSEATGDVREVEVYGHVLTEKFARIEVEDDVLVKLQGNPHIMVKDSAKDPLDHDGDGKKGGSKPHSEPAA